LYVLWSRSHVILSPDVTIIHDVISGPVVGKCRTWNDGATVDVWRPVAHVERGVKVQGGGALPDIGEVPVALNEQTAVERMGSDGVRRGALER
jgi:hypothetical protein